MLVCPRCQRANPEEAAFCHFDGAELRSVNGQAGAVRQTHLPHEFVFPSGRRCHTFDDLVQGCQAEWDVARDLLKRGVFRQFLTSVGRMDLAQAAEEAKAQPDADTALNAFIARLPAKAETGASLDLDPRRINLGTLHVGESRHVHLTVRNQGKGLLQGTLAVFEGNNWLTLVNGKNTSECLIKTLHEQQVTLRIDTRGLSAPHRYSAKLTVITNGGIVEVPVRLDLAVLPFSLPPFQGVSTPREMAEKMRAQPKPAVPLLESGDIARWFAENGWTYPVTGPAARGVAAVQQFFEGMGLSKPPIVRLEENEITLFSNHGVTAGGQLTLRTDAKKWVYARAESDTPWLAVTTPNVSGPQQAVVAFEADGQALRADGEKEGTIKLVANSGQTLSARVRVVVRRPPRVTERRRSHPLLAGALAGLMVRLTLAVPADLYARLWAAPGGGVPAGSLAAWLQTPLGDVDYLRHFVFATWWIGAILGAVVMWRRGGPKTDLVCGVIAGAASGLAASATFACLLPGLDFLPRWFLNGMLVAANPSRVAGSAWLGTAVWIGVASLAWAFWGLLASVVLRSAGPGGIRLLGGIEAALSLILRTCGMRKAAAYFAVP